jgi:glucans biosynthesis protein
MKDTIKRWFIGAVLLFFSSAGGVFGATNFFGQLVEQTRSLPPLELSKAGDPKKEGESYPIWREIKFKDSETLYKNSKSPFTVQLIHPGAHEFYTRPVYEILSSGDLRPISFSTNFFKYSDRALSWAGQFTNYAGFKIFSEAMGWGEVAVFSGSSYFRMVGGQQFYGASARAIAVNTATEKGEEFPVFERFYLRQPKPREKTLSIYGVARGKSLNGVYEFVLQPGSNTVVRVKSHLFFHETVERLGIAPITSMYKHAENTSHRFGDFRPEVHDSDGLFVLTSKGEEIWRPLDSAKMMRFNSFSDVDPIGYGLFQRDREFDHYQDLEALYHLRPSVFVRPLGRWGAGRVELIQLPTDTEFTDNINVMWVPEKKPAKGEELALEYEVIWTSKQLGKERLGRVHATRIEEVNEKGEFKLRFVVDFGWPTTWIPREDHLRAELSLSQGKSTEIALQRNGYLSGYRAIFMVYPEDAKRAIDLRLVLNDGKRAASESWVYTWQP